MPKSIGGTIYCSQDGGTCTPALAVPSGALWLLELHPEKSPVGPCSGAAGHGRQSVASWPTTYCREARYASVGDKV